MAPTSYAKKVIPKEKEADTRGIDPNFSPLRNGEYNDY